MKINPCTPPPFNAAGIEVKALYFSQSPGEKFISVYARYREGQSWAPLHIGLPSIPTLQQVRDLDRNISLDSGSYNNAHIYLRSAAGNNMTTALYTNEEGGGIQVGNVDGLSALNLQPDGGLLTYGGNEVATRNWVNNQGYLTSFTETDPLYTASIPKQLMYKGSIPGGVNLNTYTTTGVYHQNQNSNAQSGINYPIALAGKLEVVNADNGYMIYQNYTSYHASNTQYYRNYYAGQWGNWIRLIGSNEAVVHGISDAPTMMNGFNTNSIMYHRGNESDVPMACDGGYTINGSLAPEISSVQLFIATGQATGFNPDGFFWRGNNVGGPGWPGPWRQVASREWVQANFLSLANVINAQYTSAQNANFWISGSARAQHFVANSLGYAMTAQTGYYGFFTDTGSSTALPIKAKELVLSDSYVDVAPSNGLFVKGNIKGAAAAILNNLATGTTTFVLADGEGKLTNGIPITAFESGVYTPVVTVASGTASTITPQGFTFIKVGNIVHVTGRVVCAGAVNGTILVLRVGLPIASDFTNAYDLIGTVTGMNLGSASPSNVSADTGAFSDFALASFYVGVAQVTAYMQFQYSIL